LLSIPCAAALQVIIREIWRSTDPSARAIETKEQLAAQSPHGP
jgi:hypothetical protein